MGRYDTGEDNTLAPNDPYRNMERSSHRPDFQTNSDNTKSNSSNSDNSAESNSQSDNTPSKQTAHTTAQNSLRNAEKSALSNEKSFFTGSGKNSKNSKGNKSKVKFKGSKKKAIITLIIGLLMGGGAATLFSGSHMMLPAALTNLLTEATDTQYASYVNRSASITRYMLRGEDPVKTGWTGNNKYRTLTPYMTKRLKQQGIEVEGSGRAKTLKFDGETISADDFHNKFVTDTKFRQAYMKAKRNRVANYFDATANKVFNGLRNIFDKFRTSGNSETDEENFRRTRNSKFENSSTSVKDSYDKTETDTDGEETTTRVNEDVTDGKTNNSTADAEVKAKSFIDGAAKAAKASQGICMIIRVGGIISSTVATMQIYHSIQLFVDEMEPISKAMSGAGSEAPIGSTMNELVTPVTSNVIDHSDIKVSYDSANNTYNTTGETKTVEETGSPMDNEVLQGMMSGTPVSQSIMEKYSLEKTFNWIGVALGMSAGAVYTCAAANTVAAGISLVTTISAAIGTAGISIVTQMIFDFALSLAISTAISVALGFLIPTVARALFTNVAETAVGKEFGGYLANGAAATGYKNGSAGGQSLASEENLNAYAKEMQKVLAMEAEVDRLNRSPFDITSKNTFLGSIAYKLLPIVTNSRTTNAISSINSLANITSQSIASLTSNVSAIGESPILQSYMTNYGNCPNLANIGAAGGSTCMPIGYTDPDLLDLDPSDPTYMSIISNDLDCEQKEDGVCIVKEGSNLEKVIKYHVLRESPVGTPDANILSELEIGNTISSSIPIWNDIEDLANAATTAENMAWATDAKFVASDDNPDWKTTYRYYQRYIEDERILKQMGAYENSQSPIEAYIEKYRTEHPLDNSPAGVISRIAGITKDDAETVIAIAEYYQFLDNYDPETRLAMDGNATNYKTGEEIANIIRSEKPHYSSDQEVKEETTTVISQHIIYADIRNRSYAIS